MPTAGWLWYAHDGKAYHGGDGRKFGARGARARRGGRAGDRQRHSMIQPLVELYGGCVVVLKVS